ncbi:MAG: GAF domain-containing protein [Anaerolineae bacterium]|nr:GAF domain-containing protein [Anaerolineae bacterium]
MWEKIRRWFTPPVFGDDAHKSRAAVLLNGILLALSVSTIVGTGILMAVESEEFWFDLFFGVILLAAFESLRRLLYRGWIEGISWFVSLALWLSLTALLFISGGMRSLAATGYYLLLIMAGMLLGSGSTLSVGILNLLTGLLVYFSERWGWIVPRGTGSTMTDLITFEITTALTTFILQISLRDIRQRVERAIASESELAERNLELYAHREELEAYTHDVEKRFSYLQATARVAQETASVLEPGDLLTQIVTLISEYFGFYHVGIYMLDATRGWVVLQAASSEGGQQMLAREHRLNLIQTLSIGEAVRSGEPQICRDPEVDAAFLLNPDLPEVHSTVLLPLRQTQDGVIVGVLEIGSTEVDVFRDQDAIVLQSLADQVAMVISNARLLAELQRSLTIAERASGEATRESWRQWLRTAPRRGYHYEIGEVHPLLDGTETVEIQAGDETPLGLSELVVPLQVRGQVLGKLVAHKSEGKGDWTQEENAVMETLLAQLGQALDSARLYEVTQRRAVRERVRREITDNIRASLSIEEAVRRAILEVAHVLSASEMVARIGTSGALIPDEEADSHDQSDS